MQMLHGNTWVRFSDRMAQPVLIHTNNYVIYQLCIEAIRLQEDQVYFKMLNCRGHFKHPLIEIKCFGSYITALFTVQPFGIYGGVLCR